MTTVTCISDCVHQKNGMCDLEQTAVSTLNARHRCVYFEQRMPEEKENRTEK